MRFLGLKIRPGKLAEFEALEAKPDEHAKFEHR
jgi:hypothetical protein